MSQWKFEDGVDPAKHPIALFNMSLRAVADHAVGGNSCIVRFSETLKAKGLILPKLQEVKGCRLQRIYPDMPCSKCLEDCLNAACPGCPKNARAMHTSTCKYEICEGHYASGGS